MNSNDLGIIMGTPNPNELLTLPNNQGFLDHQHQRSQFHFPVSKYNIHNDSYHLGGGSINNESIAHYIPTDEAPTMFSAGAGCDNALHDTVCLVNASSVYPFLANNQSNGRKKRKRNENRVGKNQREVVHVRAKRGQATDSHSLSERLRREKINEKLRCLQDLIPGCYKTMGMAVMLDVITNYVRSLQNQIDFLSMKLSAASLFYDLNSDMDTVEQCRAKEYMYEAPILDKEVVGGGYAMQPQFYTSWPC